jgi:ribonuclease R
MLGKELVIPAGATADAEDGDLIAVEAARAPHLGPPTGRVVERLGSLKSERAVSLIAVHAHGIPSVFRRETQQDADAARPATLQGREDWRRVPFVTIDPPDAKDHDDAVHAEPDSAPNNPGGFVIDVAIADVACYVRPLRARPRRHLRAGIRSTPRPGCPHAA